MSIFEITIRSKENSTDGWPVSVRLEHRDGLSIQKSGILQLDEEDFQWFSTQLSQCKDYGMRLGQRLFQNDLLLAFREAFASSQKLMRVLLTLEVGEDDPLKTLRWERLCAPIDGSWEHLALNQRSPFSQYLPTSNSDRTYPAIARSDLRALVMVASPEGLEDFSLEHFDVERAVSGLREALGEIPYDVLAHGIPDAVGEPTLNQLCESLSAANPPYTLLHIVCHGAVRGGKTVLYWSDGANRVEPVLEQNLMRRLRQLGNKEGLPHLTFLCSCSSGSPLGGLAQNLVRELATPAIVAMTDRVSVKTGLALAGSFYPRLWEVGAVDIALQQATAGLVERYDIVVPALFGRLRDRPLFDIVENEDMASKKQEQNRGQSGGISFAGSVNFGGDLVQGDKVIQGDANTSVTFNSGNKDTISKAVFPKDKLLSLLDELLSSVEATSVEKSLKYRVLGQISETIQLSQDMDDENQNQQIREVKNHILKIQDLLGCSKEMDEDRESIFSLLKQTLKIVTISIS